MKKYSVVNGRLQVSEKSELPATDKNGATIKDANGNAIYGEASWSIPIELAHRQLQEFEDMPTDIRAEVETANPEKGAEK